MTLNPNLQDSWIQEILAETEIVPLEFFLWQKEHEIHKMALVPQQKFYSLVWKYHHRFKSWPPKELWEILLEEALQTK